MAEHGSKWSSWGRRDVSVMALVVVIAGAWAGFNAWAEQRHRTQPLDLDGWGYQIRRLKESGGSFATLFSEPSLFRGPVVSFLFGLCYFVAPFDYSVLAMNAALFALSVGVLFDAFRRLGAGRWCAAGAILLWVFYPPHSMIFGYYYAEPVLAFLSASLFWLSSRLMSRPGSGTAFALGITGGVLVLARAPFLLVVVGLPPILWRPLASMQGRALIAYCAGFLLAFIPWPMRNYLIEQEFIPFTTVGGIVLFQGTYLPGDDLGMGDLRKLPSFREIEAGEEGMSDLEQYHYWQPLAIAQIRQDPFGQISLCVRKAMRFWMYLPAHSWVPSWKTGVVALLALPLAMIGAWRGRRTFLIQLCLLWVGSLWLFHALIHAELRYNFPVLPMLFVLAWQGATGLLSAWNCSRGSRGITGVE